MVVVNEESFAVFIGAPADTAYAFLFCIEPVEFFWGDAHATYRTGAVVTFDPFWVACGPFLGLNGFTVLTPGTSPPGVVPAYAEVLSRVHRLAARAGFSRWLRAR